MLIIPAIDIKDGCVVRFIQGKREKKIYSSDPVKTARHWARQGAKLIHVVDLDGAFCGIPRNLDIVKKIVNTLDVPIQFGGGIRDIKTINALTNCGIWRVVLGTKAVEDSDFLINAFKRFKEKIIVSIDTKANHMMTHGWKDSCSSLEVFAFARQLKDMGFRQLIYTDVLKDGTLKGPNIKNTKALMKKTGLKVIASGGIGNLNDVHRLKLLKEHGLIGIIIGKALYEGRFTLTEALRSA